MVIPMFVLEFHACLGSNGIEKIIELDLNPEEKEMLTNGVESVETAIRELPYMIFVKFQTVK